MPGNALPDYSGTCHLTPAEACPLWTSAVSRCSQTQYLGPAALSGSGSGGFCDYAPAASQAPAWSSTLRGDAVQAAHAAASSQYWRQRPSAADANTPYFTQMPESHSSITGTSRSQPSSAADTSYWNSPAAMPSSGGPNEQEDDGGDPRWTLTAQATLPYTELSLDIPDLPYLVQFDPYAELVWIGTLGGRIQSCVLQWHGGMNGPGSGAAAISPYTRFVAHSSAICHLLFDERGVISVGEDNVAYHQRGGLPMPFLDDSARSRMTNDENALRHAEWYGGKQLIIGCTHAKLFFVDVGSGRLLATLDSPHGTQTMCSTSCSGNGGHEPSYVVVGGNDGQISMVDKRKKAIVRTMRAHASSVTAMAEQDGTLVTCGGSNDGQTGMFVPDGFLKVFDLRRLEQSMPVSFSGAPVQARFHPFVPNSLVILANSGAFQTCELSGGRVYNTRYTYWRSSPTDGAVGFDLSSSGECLLIADTSSLLQLWQSKGRPPKINAYSMPVEIPPIRPEPLYPKLIDIIENPFKTEPPCPQGCPSLGEALDGGPLLSAWPGEERCMRLGRPPVPIHPEVAANLQMNDFVGCMQNVHGWRQNSIVSTVLKMQQLETQQEAKANALASLSVSAGSAAWTAAEPVSVSVADCDSPSEAVRGVERLISEFGEDDVDEGG